MPLLRQASESVVLIELLQQRVQLVCTAHDAVKLRSAALQAALSRVGGGLHHKLLEILLVGSGVGCYIPQRVQNQVADNLGTDKVNGAGGRFLAVGSANIIVLRGLVVCIPIAALVIHFCAALAAVEQPGQRIRFSIAVAAPDRPAELLRGFPCSLVNDGFVGILKDFPVLFGSLLAVFVPVAGLEGLEIDGMPHVLHAGENVAHRRTPPAVGIFKLVVPAVANTLCGKVGRRAKYLFLGQNIRDLIHALAVNDHAEDAAHNRGGFLVDDPALLVLRVFQIPVNRVVAGVFAFVALRPIDGADLLGGITSVKIVHDIEERREIILGLIGAVHAVVDGNKANAVLWEGDLRIEAHTEVITTHSAEIFYKDNANLTGFNVGNQAFPVRTLKIRAAPTVVRIDRYIRKIPFTGIAREHILLMDDGITVPGKIIVAAQAAIDGGDFFL